jgi:flagellar motility protein MotE (MotC chaperone)
MDAWVIVLIVVVVILLALVALAAARRGRTGARKQEQAREHLQNAQVRQAQADRDQALAQEQVARAQRERAEVEERLARTEQEARDRVGQAEDHRTAADQLRAKAEKLAPGVTSGEGNGGARRDAVAEEPDAVTQDRAPRNGDDGRATSR